MTETQSKSRQRAEIAFGDVTSQFFARSQAFEEIDMLAQARDEKTMRLREARKAKEAAELAITVKPATKKRTKTPVS
ncbi:hypothetical protein ABFT80_14070 [Mesorhizobium sp. SB112]|uniref:hypothetical protein n=1 Tax=Mesorhizobium sp. SB112 TaxID=3151853 RepID=UPI0032669D82